MTGSVLPHIIRLMQTKTTTEAARTIGQTVFEAQRGPVMLTARDHDVAVLVSAADWRDICRRLRADGRGIRWDREGEVEPDADQLEQDQIEASADRAFARASERYA